jgi:hypothetical protein
MNSVLKRLEGSGHLRWGDVLAAPARHRADRSARRNCATIPRPSPHSTTADAPTQTRGVGIVDDDRGSLRDAATDVRCEQVHRAARVGRVQPLESVVGGGANASAAAVA